MTVAMTRGYMGGLHSHRIGVRDSTNEQTDIQTNERDGHHQDQRENRRGTYAAGPVESGGSAAWFDLPLTVSEAQVCLARTRALLLKMQAEQEALARELDESGVVGFIAQSEWLIAHRSPLDVLAGELKAAALAGWHPSHSRLAAPKRSHKAAKFTDRQMEIAIAALARQETEAA